MRCLRRALGLLLAVAVLAMAAGSASALTVYTDVIGTNVSFTGIQEASTFGDPEPLFDQPLTNGGDGLLFFPPAFSASSAGGGVDQTGSQLQLMITGNTALDTIEKISIEEFGDALLAGGGTAATGTFAGMSGFVTVQEANGVPIVPVVIPFVGVFAPSDTLTLPANPGVTIWSGAALIDVAATVPNATKATLSFDNNLFAFSEAGTSALIQKKVVDGPAVTILIVPEPGTFVLIGSGLVGLAIRARRRR